MKKQNVAAKETKDKDVEIDQKVSQQIFHHNPLPIVINYKR